MFPLPSSRRKEYRAATGTPLSPGGRGAKSGPAGRPPSLAPVAYSGCRGESCDLAIAVDLGKIHRSQIRRDSPRSQRSDRGRGRGSPAGPLLLPAPPGGEGVQSLLDTLCGGSWKAEHRTGRRVARVHAGQEGRVFVYLVPVRKPTRRVAPGRQRRSEKVRSAGRNLRQNGRQIPTRCERNALRAALQIPCRHCDRPCLHASPAPTVCVGQTSSLTEAARS